MKTTLQFALLGGLALGLWALGTIVLQQREAAAQAKAEAAHKLAVRTDLCEQNPNVLASDKLWDEHPNDPQWATVEYPPKYTRQTQHRYNVQKCVDALEVR